MAIEVIQVTEEDITVTLTDVGIRGRAGLVFRGDYDDTIQYYQGDAVRFSNNLYIATGSPALGTDPTNSTGDVNAGWELLVFGSPDQTAIVDFHVQTPAGSVVFAEGDLIKGLDGKYYWTLGSGTLDNATVLTNESNFEVRGNPVNIVGNGTISTRPTSGDEIGDFYVTDLGESSIWDGTQWLSVHTRLVDATNNGLMSSADKVKLDGIESLAEANDKVDVEFLGQTITVTSTEDGVRTTDTAVIPTATSATEGLVKIDTTTLSVNNGIVSADETIELGKLKDITAPTVAEAGRVLRGLNDGVNTTYDWISNNDQVESVRRWDATGRTNYVDQTVGTAAILGLVTGTFQSGANNTETFTLTENSNGSWTDTNSIGGSATLTLALVEAKVNDPASQGLVILTENLSSRKPEVLGGSSIVEFDERLYIVTTDIDYETNGSCAVNGVDSPGTANRTNCEATPNGVWSVPSPDVDSNWNEIGPGNLENLDDVDLSASEGTWTNTDNPILARVGTEWRLFPGLDKLGNIGDIPVPTATQAGFVLTTDGSANPTYTWNDQVARIQDFNALTEYNSGDLVRVVSENKIYLAVGSNILVGSTPVDGADWQTIGPESLSELQDTSFSTPQQGNILTFDNGAWRNLTANASVAAAITFQEIGDVPVNSSANKVLVSTDAVNTASFDINNTFDKEDVVFFSGDYYRYIGTNGATLTQSPNLDTTNWDLTNGDKYEWKDYARDVKNVQAYSVTDDYDDGDLAQVGDNIFIKINGNATAPVDAPTGNETDAVWKQIGAAALDSISDVDVALGTAELEWDGVNASLLALNPSTGQWQKFAGMDDLRNIGNVDDPSVNGSVLGFDSINNKFIWVTSVAAAASVDDWDPKSGYSANALVTHTVDGDLSIFLNILGISANASGNTTPENDPTHWEIIGPEKISNLEDVNITNEDNNDILQYKTDRWVDRTPAQVAATMNLSEIGDVSVPNSSTDNNQVLQVTFSGSTPSYAWVDRTTNTTTIQGFSTTETYTPGEVIEFQRAIYVAIDDNDSATTNLNQTPGSTNSAFWELIGPESFEHLTDSSISSPSTDQFIVYNSTTNKWTNTDLVTETEKLVDLFDLKDVDGTAASNNVLRFDGSNWVPVTPSAVAGTMLLDDMLNVGEEANVSIGDFLQKVLNSNNNVVYEGRDAAQVGAQIDLENLNNVPNSVAENSLLQQGASGFEAKTPNEIAAEIDLAKIKGIANPVTDFVLKSDGNDTYSWVSNVQETATIQTWNNGTTYAAGDLVRYQPTASSDFEVFIAKTNSTTNLNKIPNVTGSVFWELLGPESIEELNGLTVTDGAIGDLLSRTGSDTWANITPAAMAEAGISFTDLSDIDDSINNGDILFRDGSSWKFVSLSTVSNDSTRGIDLSDLKDVAETAEASNGQVLQKTSTGWKYTTLSSAIADQTSGVGIADLNDVDAPTAAESGHVLRGNHTVTGGVSSISYDWVDNEEATASIQEYVSTTNYIKGALTEENGSLYIAVVTTGPAHNNTTTPGNDSAVWDLIGPEEIDELNDVTLTSTAARDMLRRNAANNGWENVTPAILAADIRIRDLKGVPSVAVASGLLQRDPIGFGNNWVIQNPAAVATGDSTADSGIQLQNLKDVSTTKGTNQQILQTDGTTYTPTDVNDILSDGTLQSIGNVSSALELNPTTTSNDLGKVLTVRSTGAGTNADPTLASFVWEANTSSTVPGFNTGTSTNPQTYVSGSLVTFNSQIWISLATLNSATETNNTLPSPGTRNLPTNQGGGPEWELVGPETIKELNDTTVVSPQAGNLLRYDGDATTPRWVNVTAATTAGDFDLKDIKDIDSSAVSTNDFLKYDGSEWKHQATLGNLSTVIEDVDTETSLSNHDILKYNENDSKWENATLSDHIVSSLVSVEALTDVNVTSAEDGQILERSGTGWVNKFRGFDDTTPGDETGNTVTLNRFDGRSIRSIATSSGVQTITFATEALTSASLELTPQSFEWDLSSASMDAKVSVINDILFQDDFLNSINRITQTTGSSTTNLFNAGFTRTSTFLENWNHTITVTPIDPRIGGFPTAGATSIIAANLSDQNGGNFKEPTQQINWLEPIVTVSTQSASNSSRFLSPLRVSHVVTATVGNTSDTLANTSLTSLTIDGQDRTTTAGTTGPSATNPSYSRTVSTTALYKQSADGASAVDSDSITAIFKILFTKPGTSPAQTETLTRTEIVNYTATFPVLTGFLDQGISITPVLGRGFDATDVNDDGTGFRRSYTLSNTTGKDQTLWFGIRKSAVAGASLTFAAHTPGANPQVISNILNSGDQLLVTSENVPGFVGETYVFYGIPLVATGESIIVTIS